MSVNLKKILSFAKAKEMYDNYSNRNYKAINVGRPKPDSRSYWYSIKEIEDYLEYLKKEIPNINTETMGIRFYMGAYGKGEAIKGKDVSSYQNIFMYPTEEDEDIFSEESLVKSSSNMELGYNRGSFQPPFDQ